MRFALLTLILLQTLVPAEAAETRDGTHVSLSAQAETMVANDQVVAMFRIEASGQQLQKLRSNVNHISQAVSSRMKREKAAKLKTTGRRMQPVWRYDKQSRKRQRDGWQLTQDMRIVSTDPDAVPQWLDDLEELGAHISSLAFQVSPEKARRQRDNLRMRAIADFRRRAASTARALGASSYRILNLNTDTRMPTPIRQQAPMMARSESKAAPAPALESGESRISVHVSGAILLPEHDYPAK